MSFFGFDTALPRKPAEEEDLAVYTWGEDSYDGLGNALDERGDDLNDETFGGSEPVGKDFDFGSTALPEKQSQRDFGAPGQLPRHHQAPAPVPRFQPDNISRNQPAPPSESLEALWRPQSNGNEYRQQPKLAMNELEQWHQQAHLAQQASHTKFSPFDELPPQPLSQSQPRVRTLQEIEAELRSAAQPRQSPLAQSAIPAQYGTPQHQHQLPVQHQHQHQHQPPHPHPHQPLHQHQHPHQHQHLPVQQFQGRPHSRTNSTQDPSLFAEHPQMSMNQLERLLQSQHISEAPYRTQTPNELLVQMTHLPEQYPPPHRPQPQYPRQAALDFINGNMHGHELPPPPQPQQSFPSEPFMNVPGLPPGVMPAQLAEMLQQEAAMHNAVVLDPERRHALMDEANRKIMEAERLDQKRRRKAAKISKMAKYNDLMTQSDKDFITRIQVSQLVTQDPYSEDFYAQVYSSVVSSRQGNGSTNGQKFVLKFANGTGVGVGVPGHRGAGRRENAMARMQTQVERIVKNAQARQKDQANASAANTNLQGALGKISGRSYKAAPRQMLQVDSNGTAPSPSLAAALPPKKSQEEHDKLTKAAGKLGREAMNVGETGGVTRQPPLTHRQIQVAVERLYDSILAMEQKIREAPSPDDLEAREAWEAKRNELLEEVWTRSMIMVPVETSDPHPFISMLSLHKGKRLIPRLVRLLPEAKVTLMLVLFVACFYQLDVVREAHVLDEPDGQGSARWKEVSYQTDAALTILPTITSILGMAPLRLLTGLLNIMLGTGIHAVLQIVKSQPGIALLTAFMSRVDQLKHEDNSASAEDWAKWDLAFDSLLQVLLGHIALIFPSRRLQATIRAGYAVPGVDLADQIAWQFLAALAAIGSQPQQMAVVAEVRDMILEIVQAVHSNWIPDPNEAALKLANVNILLNAIGLDHTMLLAS